MTLKQRSLRRQRWVKFARSYLFVLQYADREQFPSYSKEERACGYRIVGRNLKRKP